MHQTQRKSVCLPPVTKSVQVPWYKQAKDVQLEKMHRASTKRKSVSASKIVKGRAPVKTFFFFFFFWVGELFITLTCTCSERNHKCQTEGHQQPKLQATLTTWVEADTKVCQEATRQAKQAAYKAVVHQPTAKPVHFQQTKHHLCLNQPNIAVKIISIMKCQAKQAADKTVVHHQPAKLASFH